MNGTIPEAVVGIIEMLAAFFRRVAADLIGVDVFQTFRVKIARWRASAVLKAASPFTGIGVHSHTQKANFATPP